MNDEVEVKLSEGVITDQALRELAKRLGGKVLGMDMGNWFNSEVTMDSIRHFVDGIGDTNPLWIDEEYAKNTKYGRVVAPPNWLYSVCPTWPLFQPRGDPLRGIHAFHSGNEWIFYKPIFLDDKITPEITSIGFDLKRSEFAGKHIIQYSIVNFYNQRGELVASAYQWAIRAERRAARERGKYARYTLPHPWSEEELKRIEQDVLAEEGDIRGEKPRYWEDVEIGDEMKLTKGPFGLTDMIAYCIGANPVGIKAFRAALKVYSKHPRWCFRDPNTYALEPVYAVHYNKAAANAAGLPYQYDVGAQRHCYLIQMITDWMGNDGWLKRNYAEYRRFFYFSDVLWFRGKIVDKFIDEDGEPCVGIETHAINQRGEDTMPGYSIVILPSKEHNYCPVEVRVNGEKLGMNK